MKRFVPLVSLLFLIGCATTPSAELPSNASAAALTDPRRGCRSQAPDTYRLADALAFGVLVAQVENSNGEPLSNAEVTIFNHYAPGEIRTKCPGGASQTTNAQGQARFERLYAGAIEVSPTGRSDLMQVVQIRPNETAQIRFVVDGPLPTPMPRPSR